MKRYSIAAGLFACLLASSCQIGTGLNGKAAGGKIIDHEDATVAGLTAARIADAKADLSIAYWHTSHGNQLLAGNVGMDTFYSSRGYAPGTFTLNGEGGLSLAEPGPDVGAFDGASVTNSAALFQEDVRTYLAGHAGANVVMASWCGQIGYGSTTETDIRNYLARVDELEAEYPGVVFVYMTGHSDGGGSNGQVHRYDRIIRDYCEENGKWLYDFYDIECYDPDGLVNYGDLYVTDDCNYDANDDGVTTDSDGDPGVPTNGDSNWALEWQDAHPSDWWDCTPDHTQPLNGNQKAKAAWQLWCAIAGTM